MTTDTATPTTQTAPLDPVTLEVLWNRLLSVANEQQAALMRTAFSTVVRESQDLACGVFDTRGQMMAQSITGTPGHINPMATGVRHLLNAYPPETLAPGDVLITNDPWLTSGHANLPQGRDRRLLRQPLPRRRHRRPGLLRRGARDLRRGAARPGDEAFR
jgi:hypothetical protein